MCIALVSAMVDAGLVTDVELTCEDMSPESEMVDDGFVMDVELSDKCMSLEPEMVH